MPVPYVAAGLYGSAETGFERRCLPGAKGARCKTAQRQFLTARRPQAA